MLATTREKEFRDKMAIVGVGYSRSPGVPGGFTRRSGVSVQTLAVRAAVDACNDAGLDPKELDGAVCYGLQDTVWPRNLLTALGVKNINWDCNLEGGGNCSTLCYTMAVQAVHHGICNYVLAYRGMNGRTGVRMGQYGGWSSNVGSAQRVGDRWQFISTYGMAGAPHQFAMNARRWMDLYGVTSEDLARYCVHARSNAVKNPRAIMRDPITVEDHQSSRMIVDPYHILDCCLETDVAGAVIITTAERARDLKKRPVLVSAAIKNEAPKKDIIDTGYPGMMPRLLDAAGIELKDIDVYEPYDNFSDTPIRALEEMGYCKRGEGKDFIRDGRISLDGELPMTTHGGLMNEGYVHGFNSGMEAIQQLRGDAEDLCPNWREGEHTYDRTICRQVRDPQIALFNSEGGVGGVILKRG